MYKKPSMERITGEGGKGFHSASRRDAQTGRQSVGSRAKRGPFRAEVIRHRGGGRCRSQKRRAGAERGKAFWSTGYEKSLKKKRIGRNHRRERKTRSEFHGKKDGPSARKKGGGPSKTEPQKNPSLAQTLLAFSIWEDSTTPLTKSQGHLQSKGKVRWKV